MIYFKILIFWVVRGVIGQKMSQNDKKFLPATLCISGTIYQSCLYINHVMILLLQVWNNISRCFLLFFKLDSSGKYQVKMETLVENDEEKTHSSQPITQELQVIWFWIVVHLCKMISSGYFFHFMKILIFNPSRSRKKKIE